jgi:hypothetical protein
VSHDVADPDAAAWAQHAGDLGEDGRLGQGEVDDAVRDHDVDTAGGERDGLDVAFQEFDVADPCFNGVGFGKVSISSVMSSL